MAVNESSDEQFSITGHDVLVEINFQRGDPARGSKQRERKKERETERE